MKRFLNIFFLLSTLLLITSAAKGTSRCRSYNPGDVNIVSECYHDVGPACSMGKNSPLKNQVVILFRNGIEGKSFVCYCGANPYCSDIRKYTQESVLINSARIKYAVNYSHSIVSKPGFLSSFSFRPPPVFC